MVVENEDKKHFRKLIKPPFFEKSQNQGNHIIPYSNNYLTRDSSFFRLVTGRKHFGIGQSLLKPKTEVLFLPPPRTIDTKLTTEQNMTPDKLQIENKFENSTVTRFKHSSSGILPVNYSDCSTSGY